MTPVADKQQQTMLKIPHRRRALTGSEKLMGQRMLASAQQVPQFSVTADLRVEALLKQRAAFTPGVSLTPLLLRKIAEALAEFPSLNAMLCGEEVVCFDTINIGVAMDTPSGLRVPVIGGVERLTVVEIAERIRELADRARRNRLTLADLSYGTVTVSNLGMFGVAHFTPIINLPQATILGVAGVRRVVAADAEDRFAPASVMNVTVVCDHRVVDGATAARFLAALQARMEAAK